MNGPLKTCFERYENDPAYRQLVDLLQAEIEHGSYTPSELRSAVIMAATLVEYRTVRPLIYGHDPEIGFFTELSERNKREVKP